MPLRTIAGKSIRFVEAVIDSMNDWVRVIDRNDNIIFINKAMSEGLKNIPEASLKNPVGEKCYIAIGKQSPCENCTSRKAVFDGVSHIKEEVVGSRIFSVMSSPVAGDDGEIIAVVEVLRDITEMKQLQHRILEQNIKLQNDLALAKKLQCSLLPRQLPEDKIDFSFIYKPCEALGGDFVDIFSIDADHVGVYIADVSGHGVPASMLTVFLRSTINKKLLSPAAALNELYREFNANYADQEMYITVFYAIVNITNKTLTYANAGHNVSPVLFGPGRFECLITPGIPISNWLDSSGYRDSSRQLQKGDRLFLYTDGIIELQNADKEQFGEERLLNIVLDTSAAPSVVLNRIIDAAGSYTGSKKSSDVCDDITLALLQVK